MMHNKVIMFYLLLYMMGIGGMELTTMMMFERAKIWQKQGQVSVLKYNDKEYDAVTMKEGIKVIQPGAYPNPIIYITTASEDTIAIVIADKKREGSDLLQFIAYLENVKDAYNITNSYEQVQFPMLDARINVPSDQDVTMFEEPAQIIIQLNELGIREKSYARISATWSLNMDRALVINKPFFIWMKQKNKHEAIFAYYMHTDNWKECKKKTVEDNNQSS